MTYAKTFNNQQAFYLEIEDLRQTQRTIGNTGEILVKSVNVNFECKFDDANFGDLNPFTFEDCHFKSLSFENGYATKFKNTTFGTLLISSGSNRPQRVEISFDRSLFGNISIENLKLSKYINANFENANIETLVVIEHANLFEMYRCSVGAFGIEDPNKNMRGREFDYYIDQGFFISTRIKNPANLDRFIFTKTSDFINCEFEKTDKETEHVYRTLKKTFSDFRNDVTADRFGFLEKKSSYNRMKFRDEPMTKSIGFAYWLINDLGNKPFQPLSLLVFFSAFIAIQECSPESFFMTLIGPFKYLGGTLQASEFTFVAFSKNLLVSLLWFFTVVAIRKRFKIEN